MLMAVPDMLFLLTRDGVYLNYYARDPATLFAPPDVFLGKNMRDTLPGDLAAEFFRAFERVAGSSDPIEVVYSLPVGGEVRHFEARLVGVEDDRIMSIVRDVTDQKHAELSLRRSERALRDSHARIRYLARRLVATQERERSRIARELHDDLSQKLALLSMELNQLADDSLPRDEQLGQRIRSLTAQAAAIASDVHRISHALHPSMLATLGVVKAVEKHCADFAAAHGLAIEFTCDRPPSHTSPEVELCTFRIVQEALQNAVKHGGTAALHVHLTHDDESLRLQVADSGRGFEPDEAEGRGLGLVSMRERVDALSGEFRVQASADRGTRIDVRIPLSTRPAPVS
jgi:signal transduction histidine kinase